MVPTTKGLYSKVVAMQLINGTHYEMTLQVFDEYYLEVFFKSKPNLWDGLIDIISRLGVSCKNLNFVDNTDITSSFQELLIYIEQNNIEKQLKEFDDDNNENPMFRWCRMYMDQVLLLLAFHRSIKIPDLCLYLTSIEKLATYLSVPYLY